MQLTLSTAGCESVQPVLDFDNMTANSAKPSNQVLALLNRLNLEETNLPFLYLTRIFLILNQLQTKTKVIKHSS